jgi:3-oxoacyl-[acyl-carrier protein] reductase
MSTAKRLDGRVCLVTGAGAGLGRSIAETFAMEGAVVIVNDVNESAANATVELCRQRGAPAGSATADVSDSSQVDAMFAGIYERHGHLDVLVNNAGIGSDYAGSGPANAPRGPAIASITDDAWHRLLGVHLDGTFFCSRAAVPHMVERGTGSIVQMASIAGISGMGSVSYSAAKGGILGMTRSLAQQVAPYGVRVNAVCPGIINAGITVAAGIGAAQAFAPSIPMRRLGEARDIAYAVLYLASDESAYTTGQWLSPNGGLVM